MKTLFLALAITVLGAPASAMLPSGCTSNNGFSPTTGVKCEEAIMPSAQINAQVVSLDYWSTSQAAMDANGAPFYVPVNKHAEVLASNEIIIGHPTGGVFEMDVFDRFPLRAWVREPLGTRFVVDKTTGRILRLAECNNKVYSSVPFPPVHDGRDGIDGRDGYNGRDGRDGVDGRDGYNGRDTETQVFYVQQNPMILVGVSFGVQFGTNYTYGNGGNDYSYCTHNSCNTYNYPTTGRPPRGTTGGTDGRPPRGTTGGHDGRPPGGGGTTGGHDGPQQYPGPRAPRVPQYSLPPTQTVRTERTPRQPASPVYEYRSSQQPQRQAPQQYQAPRYQSPQQQQRQTPRRERH